MNEDEYKAFMEKYTQSELDNLKNKIRMARFNYIIKDPYPNHSFYETLSFFEKLSEEKPEEVSIHRAYREGMEFMWSLIKPLVE